MRETAGTLNRTWLAILAVLLLAAGTAGLLFSIGQAAPLAAQLNPGLTLAGPQDRVLAGSPLAGNSPAVATGVAVVGALLAVISLLWLGAQVPKRHQAGTFRLHSGQGADGYTRCEPKVLQTAVEEETSGLPGVTGASAVLRGSANQPELTLSVKVDDRADVQDVLRRIHEGVVASLETALEVPLRRTAIQFEVSGQRSNQKAVVV